jgi:hypothetical protein
MVGGSVKTGLDEAKTASVSYDNCTGFHAMKVWQGSMEENDRNRTQERDTKSRTAQGSIPDFAWINRNLPIADVARKLDLRFAQGDMLHCWHPERHQAGDRIAAASIWMEKNRIKCFGVGCGLFVGVVDLVMDVRGGGCCRCGSVD